MVVPLRRRATRPSAQRTSEGREAKRCQRHCVYAAEALNASNTWIFRCIFSRRCEKCGLELLLQIGMSKAR